jgi:hypothetical protein
MSVKISVILPGIRRFNWLNFYNSVGRATSHEYEVIIVSPYELPKELKNKKNIKYIQDWGCPSRCQQLGLIAAEGEYVTWGADDGFFVKEKIDKAIKVLEENKNSSKDILTCKYVEGSNPSPEMYQDKYYKINHAAGLRSEFIPDDYWILNVGIVDTEYAKSLGGWDSQFEVTTISHMDFAVRCQRNGSQFFMMEEPIFICDHMPGTAGDHGPVHYSHIEHDEPLFREIYNNPSSVERIKIDIDNWKDREERWSRRF